MRQKKITMALLTLIVFSIPVYAQKESSKGKHDILELLSRMNVHEKALLIVGAEKTMPSQMKVVAGAAGYTYPFPSLGIPSEVMTDGPMGVRISPFRKNDTQTYYCTAFPSCSLLAATWDKELASLEGQAMGNEARNYDINVILTPGINIMRNPLCGRNFEYFSEDPVLSGYMGAAVIKGIQSKGVAACLKHFIANNQQVNKLNNDARIPLQALREIYMKGFEICIKEANPWAVMSSYNKIGGLYTQANPELLKTVLRKEWNYQGMVMTDWYKKRNTVEQVLGGSQLMMPGEWSQVKEIEKAVKDSILSEKKLDECAGYVLSFIEKIENSKKKAKEKTLDLNGNAALSRRIATEGMVLLKNKENTLPLEDKNLKASLFGVSAYRSIVGGGGSSNVNKPYIINISDGLKNEGVNIDADLEYIYDKYCQYQEALLIPRKAQPWEKLSYFRPMIQEMDITRNKELLAEQAGKTDVAIIVLGRTSTEESDNQPEEVFGHNNIEKVMIDQVCKEFHARHKKVIVVLNVGGVIETESWKNLPDAILLSWFPGQECGNAVSDILTGKVCPSGKLPMTFPIKYKDIPSSNNYPIVNMTKSGKNFDYTNYEENIWVGYRYFTTVHKKVSYPFGYGLSYTTFVYDRPRLRKKGDKWIAQIRVTNTGNRTGREVVQLYVTTPFNGVEKPVYELKGFTKTSALQPGEKETISIALTDYDLASFDTETSTWIEGKGRCDFLFGSSSEEIKACISSKITKKHRWKVNNVLRPVDPISIMHLKNRNN
jgi:beta-glucosidase